MAAKKRAKKPSGSNSLDAWSAVIARQAEEMRQREARRREDRDTLLVRLRSMGEWPDVINGLLDGLDAGIVRADELIEELRRVAGRTDEL